MKPNATIMCSSQHIHGVKHELSTRHPSVRREYSCDYFCDNARDNSWNRNFTLRTLERGCHASDVRRSPERPKLEPGVTLDDLMNAWVHAYQDLQK